MSEKQRARYFEWNGKTIKGKGKHLPKSFYKDKDSVEIRLVTLIEDLKDIYKIGELYKNKLKAIHLCTPENKNPFSKYILYEFMKGLDPHDLGSYEPVIVNPKKIGTPKMYLIKGQDIYSGNLREHERGKVMDEIKKCYLPYVKDLEVIKDYPVNIDCELHYPIKNPYHKVKQELGGRWDIDNFMFPYTKAFPDLLVSLKKLKDDDRLFVPSTIKTKFIPIENNEDRKLVFIITKDESEAIRNHSVYKNPETYETEDKDLVRDYIPLGKGIEAQIVKYGTKGDMSDKVMKEFEKIYKDGKDNTIY